MPPVDYIEESHKITDIIPLNFLQCIDEEQIYESYNYCTAGLYHHNAVNTNTPTVKKRGRPPKSAIEKQDKNTKTYVPMVKQAIKRKKQADRTVNNNTVTITKLSINPLHPSVCDISNNINPDNINTEIKKTMAINSDLSEPDSSKLLTTYWSPRPDRYQIARPLVHPGTEITVLHSHIPKQSEVDTFLHNLRAKVLHTTCLPVQVVHFVSEYLNSPCFELLYQYIQTGYLKGLQHVRKKAECRITRLCYYQWHPMLNSKSR